MTFQLLILACQQEGGECTKGWEGAQPGQLNPADQRDIPYRMVSCSIYNLGEEEREGGHLE